MPLSGEYAPSPQGWVANQVKTFEESGGTAGNTLRGVPVVVLWTKGRKTGQVRKTPLMRVEHDGRYAVVASMGGAPKHPVWYLNLKADPHVTLQDGGEAFDGVAREVTGDEKAEWWKRAVGVWPDYESYQQRTSRDIPVVVIERT